MVPPQGNELCCHWLTAFRSLCYEPAVLKLDYDETPRISSASISPTDYPLRTRK
jgi:hypothetical protein